MALKKTGRFDWEHLLAEMSYGKTFLESKPEMGMPHRVQRTPTHTSSYGVIIASLSLRGSYHKRNLDESVAAGPLSLSPGEPE